MATIERRKLKNGSAVRYRVKWRTGGTGAWDGETFDAYADAKRWKGLVESNDHQRPGLDQLRAFGFTDRARGVDLLDAAPVAAPAVPSPAVADPSPEALAPLLVEYAEQVIEDLDHVLGYTKRRYRGLLRRHVAPYFQDKRVDEPEFTDLQRWQREMVASGLSRKTIANIRGSVLVPVFKAACKPGRDGTPPWRQSNPLEGLRLPVGRTRRRDVITSERDIRLYMSCAYEVDPEAGDLLMVAMATGMRWGDLAGLRCRDVDLEQAEIRPSQVYARGSEDHDRWELREYTKSIAGDERVIPIPPGIVELLRRRLDTRRPDQLVFTAPMGGPWDHSRFRERRYLRILALAQQRGLARHITPHTLRHSLLTILADEGTDPKVMQHIAGHESVTTTYNTYVRATRTQRARAAATVDQRIPMGFRAVS